MNLRKMLFKEIKQNEYEINRLTSCLFLDAKELTNLDTTKIYDYIFEKSKLLNDGIIKLDYDKIYLFITFKDKYLGCTIGYKDYLGNLGNFKPGTFKGITEINLYTLIRAMYIMFASGKFGDPTGELAKISVDFTSLRDKIGIQLSNDIKLPAGSRVLKYIYKTEGSTLGLEKVEDYELKCDRELKVKIGDVYVLDCTDGLYLYGGTFTGTAFTRIKDVDKNNKSIVYRELLKDGIEV